MQQVRTSREVSKIIFKGNQNRIQKVIANGKETNNEFEILNQIKLFKTFQKGQH